MKQKIAKGICSIIQSVREVISPRVVSDGFYITGQISRDPNSPLGPDYNVVTG